MILIISVCKCIIAAVLALKIRIVYLPIYPSDDVSATLLILNRPSMHVSRAISFLLSLFYYYFFCVFVILLLLHPSCPYSQNFPSLNLPITFNPVSLSRHVGPAFRQRW